MTLGIPTEPVTPPEPTEPPESPPAPPVVEPGAPSPDAIRNSPEYKEALRQNRLLARQAAEAKRAEQQARLAAEQARQAAEAQQQADLEAELESTLGADGVAAYNEIAELSQSDPVAAARKLAQLMASARGQTPAAGAPTAPPPAPAPEAPPVATPAPPRGLGADAPLGQPPAANQRDPYDVMADELEARFNAAVERNQDPSRRNRMTMRDRADAVISYVGSALLRGGARPRS